MAAIEVSGLVKSYGRAFGRKREVLHGLDLTVPTGTIFGLMGPNGAGKTTCIKALLGIVRADSGHIKVLGGQPDDPTIRARVGYLPERLHFTYGATALSFLVGISRMRRLPDPMAESQRQLGRVGLVADGERKVSGFSKGMMQRLGLAAALLGQPDLLILDEPTDGVDPMGRAEVREIVREEHERGATIFLNSHLLAETERLCDHIGILIDGRLVCEGTIDALCRNRARWEARFEGGTEEALQEIGFTSAGDVGLWFYDTASLEELNDAVAKARGDGAMLVGLAPHVRDLEEVFAAAVEEHQS